VALGEAPGKVADAHDELAGFFWYLQKYAADQTLVQRYLVAKSHREALKGISFGALLCVPVWALFLLVGTMLWSFYRLTGEQLPSYISKADQVFPHFLSTHIPAGIAGLLFAALMAAAMSGLASDLNCLALICVEDFYGFFRKGTSDRVRLKIARIIVGVSVMAGISCHDKRGAAGSEYDQLQPVSDTGSVREGSLLPAVFAVTRIPARHLCGRSRKARKVGSNVAAKSTGHNHLPGKARIDQAAAGDLRGILKRECLLGADSSLRHGAWYHGGKQCHHGRNCQRGIRYHRGTRNHRGTTCHQ
jgi:hypothetical protein